MIKNCSIELSKPRQNKTEIISAVRIPGIEPTKTAVNMGASAMGSKFGKTASSASLLFNRTLPNSNINLNKLNL